MDKMDENTRVNTPPTEDSRAPTVVSSFIDEKSSLHHTAEAEPALEQKPRETGSVQEVYTQQGQQGLSEQDPKAAAQDELRRVQTREEGTEYPTGIKLGLISLALCLAVFLMALVLFLPTLLLSLTN
jgi:hypothetical protein